MSKPRSPLAEARQRLLAARVGARGGELPLTRFHYDQLADDGLSRADVNAAVDALVTAGEATLDTEGGRVTVRLRGGSE